jgi:hypothetical protein
MTVGCISQYLLRLTAVPPVGQVVIEEIDPKQPEEVAKAAGQKRKADAAAMESAPAKKPAGQVTCSD